MRLAPLSEVAGPQGGAATSRRHAPSETWTFFDEPLACQFLFGVCVLPEEYKIMDLLWSRLQVLLPFSTRCLVQQWIRVQVVAVNLIFFDF